jgi:hypothetical protein
MGNLSNCWTSNWGCKTNRPHLSDKVTRQLSPRVRIIPHLSWSTPQPRPPFSKATPNIEFKGLHLITPLPDSSQSNLIPNRQIERSYRVSLTDTVVCRLNNLKKQLKFIIRVMIRWGKIRIHLLQYLADRIEMKIWPRKVIKLYTNPRSSNINSSSSSNSRQPLT